VVIVSAGAIAGDARASVSAPTGMIRFEPASLMREAYTDHGKSAA